MNRKYRIAIILLLLIGITASNWTKIKVSGNQIATIAYWTAKNTLGFHRHVYAQVNQIDVVNLPQPQIDGVVSVEKALNNRRSRRQFQDKEVSIEDLSQILWAAYGITLPVADNPDFRGGFRTAPSAGALYPLEIYIAVGKVQGLEPGVYKYFPDGHKIIKVLDEDVRAQLSSAALGQEVVKEAPVSIIYAAVFARTAARYGSSRGERYVFMESGYSAENVYLQAEALGLGTVAVGAFVDAKVAGILRLPRGESPLNIMPIGHYAR